MRRIRYALFAMLVAVPMEAQFRLAPDEVEYVSRLVKAQKIKGDSTGELHKAALRDLEPRLRAILGPIDLPGFGNKSVMNNDDLYEADEDFDQLDGIRYPATYRDSLSGSESMAVVTTEPLFRAWLKRHWEISESLSIDVAVTNPNALTFVFPFDAHATAYVHIPRDTLRALGIPFGWIGNFEQDDCPCAAHYAVFAVTRGRQFVLVALALDHPIPRPAECRLGDGVSYRLCYEQKALRDPRLGQLIAQIRRTVADIKR